MAPDDVSSSDRHLRELGLDPEFSIDQGEAALKDLDERLAEDLARRKAVAEQLEKRRKAVDQARGGRVVADHDEDEDADDELVAMHQPSYWRGRSLPGTPRVIRPDTPKWERDFPSRYRGD